MEGTGAEEGTADQTEKYAALQQLAKPRVVAWRVEVFSLLPELHRLEINCGELAHPTDRPFKKRVVKARRQILTDGLAKALDWQRAGVNVPPTPVDAMGMQEWRSVVAINLVRRARLVG